MNRMNHGMGCCMTPANGRQATRRNPEASDNGYPMTGRNPNVPGNAARKDCPGHADYRSEEIPSDLPVGNRKALLNFIHEEGFASYEAILYLDTHPDDPDAGDYFRLHNRRYQAAVKEYGRLYGPLTINTASSSPSETWNWMQQPWPWEGGDC